MPSVHSPNAPQCSTCHNLRHVPAPEGGFTRCPDCFGLTQVVSALAANRMPTTWAQLTPSEVITRFGQTSAVGQAIEGLVKGTVVRAHAYSLAHDNRSAFVGAVVHGWLARGLTVQVLDTGDLSRQHFDKDRSRWNTLQAHLDAVVLSFGREVEPTIGQFYFRHLLDRSVAHDLPFVLLTDYELAVHLPRYSNLDAVISAARFDALNLSLLTPTG